MRKVILFFLTAAVSLFAQPTQAQFDQGYWASQPPAIQALQTLAPGARLAQAMTLAQVGYLIDYNIMVLGEDPYDIESERAAYGYKAGVPSMNLQPIGAVPGYAMPGLAPLPGQVPYPTVTPTGWIPLISVATIPPPYNPPQPPAGPVYTLGPQISAGMYAVSSSNGTFPPAGSVVTIGGVKGTLGTWGIFSLEVLTVQ